MELDPTEQSSADLGTNGSWAMETETFRLHRGAGPVLFSVPHAGTECPGWLATRLTESARRFPDTDWFVDRLYGFAPERGQSMLVARNTRYLVDLNRPTSNESLYPGQATTGLCPTEQFDGAKIYQSGAAGDTEEPDQQEIEQRVERYWNPYHRQLSAELDRLVASHGYAVLFDCHSIDSVLPRLFDGTLPVLNLGTNHGATAAPKLQSAVEEALGTSGLSMAVNGRFVGGTITRSYGRPAQGVHALQLELGWQGYLQQVAKGPCWDEAKAERLIWVLQQVATVLEQWRPQA